MASQLVEGGTVVLATVAGVVTGRVALGPDAVRGPAYWDVDVIIFKTSRPGIAPIPRIEIYLNDPGSTSNLQALAYDGSLGSGTGSCRLTRGQQLIAVWTGGTAGDIASFTVTGTKGSS